MREIKFRGKRVDNGEWVYGTVKRDKPDAVKELPVVEVKQEPTPRWMDLEGQALMCLVIILLVANVINQVIKLCG